MNKINLALFKAKTGELTKISIDGENLDEYYERLECDTFDITHRRIGETYFDIFCDDEGLLRENPIIAAVDSSFAPALVGNLIFAHHDKEGNTTGISDEDFRLIQKSVINIINVDALGQGDTPPLRKAIFPLDF